MQRKNILKGKIYTAGQKGQLVRVLDTTASPVPAERWDFVTQTWVGFEVEPRDLDELRPFDNAELFIKYADTINAALRRRYLRAMVEQVNAAHAVGDGPLPVGIAAGRHEWNLDRTVDKEDAAEVKIDVRAYNRMVDAYRSAPASGVITMTASVFFSWAVSVLDMPVPEVADIVLPPTIVAAGFEDELDADRVRRVKADAAYLSDRNSRASKVTWDKDFEAELLQRAEAEYPNTFAALGKHVSRHKIDQQLPDLYAEVLAKHLAALGLRLEDTRRYSVLSSMTPQDILDTAARLRALDAQ